MTAIYASLAGGVTLIPLYLAATAGWHRLIDWADQHTDRPSPLPIRAHRQPIAAITAQPHWEASDELGPWNPSRHKTMPALLAGEPIGAAA